jgi:signal peptidase I
MLTRYRYAIRFPLYRLPRGWRLVIDWFATIGIAAILVLVLENEVAKPYRIPTSSMEPTLHCDESHTGCFGKSSDRVLAAKIVYTLRSPARGDVVVFKAPPAARAKCEEGGTFVKRIVGLPGEVVSEKHGLVYVNGKHLLESYVDLARRDGRTHTWHRLGKGQYFVMGDNRAASCDSRDWGPVPRGNLIGPVIATYWPLNRIGFG